MKLFGWAKAPGGDKSLKYYDVTALTNKLTATGVPVVTPGGESIEISAAQIIIVRDPDNLMLELM